MSYDQLMEHAWTIKIAAASVTAAKPPDSIKDNKTGNTAIQIVNLMWDGLGPRPPSTYGSATPPG
ncbi:hypothetical protein [Actinoplanes subtropicus]|uniref:hypothetical protein n=1 Tax=Actinoplanes subtropicus TaxID=543632 RepID=UPI0004C35A65|nr:hypothetical protein [Actinoplanes subtropicus]